MLAVGTVLFDKYRVEQLIGQGGMASVYAATHLHLDERVAIKTLLPEMSQNATVVQRFVREARAAVRLKGEHVTRVLDVGMLPSGAPYMVMELLAGVDLAQLLKERGHLPASEAVDCVLQVCEALAEAHNGGIVHRDIKPSNLFITRRPDGSELVKVLDFGISKVTFEQEVSNLTKESVIGTPSYMSPEQLRGSSSVDARTDIWSLGVVLYRILSGTRPFKADSVSALAIQAATEPTPPLVGSFPPGIEAVVYRCLEKDVTRRFQSVAELAYALAPYAGNSRAAALVTERTQNILRWTPAPVAPLSSIAPVEPTTLGSSAGALDGVTPSKSRRSSWMLVAGAALGVITAIAVSVSGPNSPRPASGTAESIESVPAAPTVIMPPAVHTVPAAANAPALAAPIDDAGSAASESEKASRERVPPRGRASTGKRVPPATRPAAKRTEKPEPKPTPKPTNPLDTRM